MKKLLLGLGSVAAVIAPVAAVVSCGDDDKATTNNDTTPGTGAGTVQGGSTTITSVTSGVAPAILASDVAAALTDAQITSIWTAVHAHADAATITEVRVTATAGGTTKFLTITITAGATEAAFKTAAKAATISTTMPAAWNAGGNTGGTATTKVTVTLTAVVADANAVADAIMGATGFGATTTDADLIGLNSAKVTVSFAAGAAKTDIATAFTNAIRGQSTFTNCFTTA